MAQDSKRQLLVGKGWIQACALVALFGFFIMGLLAFRTYDDGPPIPDRVQTADGTLLFTGDDIGEGQKIFLAAGLMEYGSILGHGAWLGPDYTADYLRRAANIAIDEHAGADAARELVQADFQANRYDEHTGVLVYSPEQALAFDALTAHYGTVFRSDSTELGLKPEVLADEHAVRAVTSFISWTAWISAAHRDGKDYSYTNNWPPEPRVGNTPTASVVVWSVISLISLLVGIGVLFAVFGRWGDKLGWKGREAATLSFREPGEVMLTPGQRSTRWYFAVMVVLFGAQAMLGAATEHYRAHITDFFGIDLAQWLPYNLTRTWHLQLALFWVVAAFLAAGIFLTPLIARREPRGQGKLSYILLGAVAVVVFGSLICEALSIHGKVDYDNFFAAQQFTFLDLARFWQILLVAGLAVWVAILWRGMRHRLANEHMGNMPWLFFLAALAIPAVYAVGLLARPGDNFTVTEFWRFWVVHLWVEDFLELFTTVMVAYMFVLLGVVRERVGMIVIYLDVILYSAGGVVGTMHHMYFNGTPVETMALGAVFSALEVVPLTFLTVEAWSFLQLGSKQEARSQTPFPHRWAVMFLVAVGFWNFLGAGVFGFLINLPIVSYYEIGTALTANHAHAAMMGVYGMLACAFALFCVRYMIPAGKWPDKLAKLSFWSLNIGLAWMVFATLFPIGILQLYKAVGSGYYEARELTYIQSKANTVLEWLRMPGDIVFMLGGIAPLLWIMVLAVKYRGTGGADRPEDSKTHTPDWDVPAPELATVAGGEEQ
ncbi:nitric-oxide reductase large subunit [Nocardia huaxiensis]|uniref:nitric-oxide reductase large subunit n=1 Tax=Nocardia huaxiensis TaxID=2755382 RepID=UPI001E56CE02|nr:cbb3-type cytochrome c oxidase subunit I [Nocardia huaxiensis]UFS95126.1 cbb3-type cytochrome c oxidase subunit I [Nocardia huaxiensis]